MHCWSKTQAETHKGTWTCYIYLLFMLFIHAFGFLVTNVLLAHWVWRRGSRENYNPQSACYRHTFWTDISVRAHSECLYSCLPLKSVPLWMPGVEHLCDVCKFAPQLQYSQIQTTLGKAVCEWTHVNTVLSLNICMIFWGEHWLILNINLTF